MLSQWGVPAIPGVSVPPFMCIAPPGFYPFHPSFVLPGYQQNTSQDFQNKNLEVFFILQLILLILRAK